MQVEHTETGISSGILRCMFTRKRTILRVQTTWGVGLVSRAAEFNQGPAGNDAGGDRISAASKIDNVQLAPPPTGNAAAAALRRLRKDRPDLHGAWLPWLKENFGWSEDTAQKYVRVAKAFGNTADKRYLDGFSISGEALRLLSGPGGPGRSAGTEDVFSARPGLPS